MLSHARSAEFPLRQSGRIAQLVEQLTLNQRVQGSSPGAPTNHFNNLDQIELEQARTFYTGILQFCSRFELHHRNLRKLHVAPEIVRIENRLDIAKAVASECRDLRHGRIGKRKPHYC